MKKVTLYRFVREDGGTTVSPNEPDCEYTTLLRLVADYGKALTKDGVNVCKCIDTDSADGWYEVDYQEEEEQYVTELQEV